MTAIYLVLLTVFLYSIASIIRRQISEIDTNLNYIFSVIFQLLGGVGIIIFSLLLGFGHEYQNFIATLNPYIVVKILIGGVLWFLATVTSFKALNTITASKYSIIETLSPLVSIILALLFLGESFSRFQALGMFLILLSVIAVIYDKNEKLSQFSSGERIAFISAILSGVALANDKGIFAVTPLAPTLALMFFLPGVIGIIARPRELLKLPQVKSNKNVMQQLILMSVVWSLAALSYYKAIVISNSISLVVSLSQLTVVFTVLLGLIFLKETKQWQLKVVAGLVSVAGLILMSV